MKGFVKRDFYLLWPSIRIYGICLLGMFVLFLFAHMANLSFLTAYAYILSVSSVISLFNYDEANRWQSYASTIPGGRKTMVDGRYTTAILLVLLVSVVICLINLADGQSPIISLFYIGVGFLVHAIFLPMCYKFGVNKSRFFIMAFIAVISLLSVGLTALSMTLLGNPSLSESDMAALGSVLTLVVGAVAIVLSHRVSVGIMARKDL